MGVKIELCYLSDKYSYWIDSPIWDFGDSNAVNENSGKFYQITEEEGRIVVLL